MANNNSIDVHIGNIIRARRNLLGMSMDALGEKIGVTYQQISKYEFGTNSCRPAMLMKMASVLQIPVSEFFDAAPQGKRRPLLDPMADGDVLTMVRNYVPLKAPARRAVRELARSLNKSA